MMKESIATWSITYQESQKTSLQWLIKRMELKKKKTKKKNIKKEVDDEKLEDIKYYGPCSFARSS